MSDLQPTNIPNAASVDVTVHIVLDETSGENNRFYREVNQTEANENSVVQKIVRGEYLRPVRVIAFNVGKGWARDVTVDVAQAVLEHARNEHKKLSPSARRFIETVLGQNASIRALG
jgi:hypothetical protein